MKTIDCITTRPIWENALKSGKYTHSTITSGLEEVGFIHATTPDQTMDVIPRFVDQKDVILLLVDADKVTSPVKFEVARSGRKGLSPHIYGSLNVSAVYDVIDVARDNEGSFIVPDTLIQE